MDFYVGYCYYIHMNVRKIRRTGAALFIAIFLLSTGSCGLLELFGFQGPAAPELVLKSRSGVNGNIIVPLTPVSFDISDSYDPNDDPYGISWTLTRPPGSTSTLSNDAGYVTSFTPTGGVDGKYVLTATLSDGRLEESYVFRALHPRSCEHP
jgi:hypothetical protein